MMLNLIKDSSNCMLVAVICVFSLPQFLHAESPPFTSSSISLMHSASPVTLSTNPVSRGPSIDVHRNQPAPRIPNPVQFLESVSEQYKKTLLREAMLTQENRNLLVLSVETDTLPEWTEVAVKLEDSRKMLDRCERHLTDALSPDITKSVFLEACRAQADLQRARNELKRAEAESKILFELVELGLQINEL